jgi:hypothetical protein
MIKDELLDSLDAGADSDLDHTAIANDYLMEWWTSDDDEIPANWVLTSTTITALLKFHRKVTGRGRFDELQTEKTIYTWNRNVSFIPEGVKMDCNSCRLYRAVTLGVLDNTQDLRHRVHGLEVAYEERADNAIRRAAGFFQLYEAALMKEFRTDELDTPEDENRKVKGKGRANSSDRVEVVRKRAEAEFRRLSDAPSLKWTGGVDLTVDDILKLQISHPPGMTINSGYQKSLPWGQYGEESDLPPSPRSSLYHFSEIDIDQHMVPDISNPAEFPTHFTLSPLRHYIEDAPSPQYRRQDPDILPSAWLERPGDGYIPIPPPIIPSAMLGDRGPCSSSCGGSHQGSDTDADSVFSPSGDEQNLAAAAAAAFSDSEPSSSSGHGYGAEIGLAASDARISSEGDLGRAAAEALSDSDVNELVGNQCERRENSGLLVESSDDDFRVPDDEVTVARDGGGSDDDNENEFDVPMVEISDPENDSDTLPPQTGIDDGDSDGALGGMILAALLGGQFNREDILAAEGSEGDVESDDEFPVPESDSEIQTGNQLGGPSQEDKDASKNPFTAEFFNRRVKADWIADVVDEGDDVEDESE